MASTKNQLDYSNLNTSLQPKRKINSIKTDVTKQIWDIFLKSNNFDTRKSESIRNNKLNEFASNIENGSEWMKAKFAFTIDYLFKNNLLKSDNIKSLKIKELSDQSKSTDDKLWNILKELTKDLSESDKLKIDQKVSEWLLNLSEESRNAGELGEKISDLEQQNSDLKNELDALDAVSEIAETAVLKRRSRNNMIRVWNSIKNINESGLDAETKARKVLWQANSFALFGSWKRFDWINKLPKKIDINKEYNEAVNRLKDKMNNSTNNREKVAIRYIMRNINKAYEDYIKATNISVEDRKQNMRDINTAMAA